MVLIAEESFSAATSHSTAAVFSSTYENYLVMARYVQSASATITARLRVAGVDASGGNYDTMSFRFNDTAGNATAGASAQTSWLLQPNAGTWAISGLTMTLTGPALAAATTYASQLSSQAAAGAGQSLVGGGVHDLATAYDALSLIPSSGTITGNIRIYGLRNSV